jgi:hypothetical protein
MTKKILIVEDSSDSFEIMNLFITRLDHQAIKAENSHEVLTFQDREAILHSHGYATARCQWEENRDTQTESENTSHARRCDHSLDFCPREGKGAREREIGP